ncbi:MAG: hypothetical protein D6737_11570 [Chloroflexi bacterium]|nr:MAG: hypothetical protein D6737_11570 [Chloroflexota bacterium]
MTKHKRTDVSQDMRKRLRENRHGRMTTDQWKDMVTEPVGKLLALMIPMAPVVVLAGSRFLLLGIRRLWFVVLVILVVTIVPLVFRAMRYSRAKVRFATLYAAEDFHTFSFLMFWKKAKFYTENNEEIRFNRRLAPHIPLERDRAYLVYYIEDAGGWVLLSIAPADHPEAEKWKPSERFNTRFAHRREQSS